MDIKKELDNTTKRGAEFKSNRLIESRAILANSLLSSTKESPITFPGIGISVTPLILILLFKLIFKLIKIRL